MRRVTVSDYEAGLLYVNGAYARTVPAGRYWETELAASRRIVVVDLRVRTQSIAGQELVTRDKANVRLSVGVQFRVVDPVKAVQEVQSYLDMLHQDVQMPLRGLIAQLDLDELLESRDQVDRPLLEQAAAAARRYGVELIMAGIKDVILPGELRAIMNKVVEAKKSAQAALVSAREEVATARARQNVAAMMREHPAMLELLRLDAAKEMAKSRGNTFVLGGAFALTRTDGQG